MFGQQRIQMGVLIEPPSHISIPTGDAQKLEEFKDLIWFVSYLWTVNDVMARTRMTDVHL